MTLRIRSGNVALSLILSLFLPPGVQGQAKSRPAAPHFALMGRVLAQITINRVLCGLDVSGDICIDGSGYDALGGGFWPKNSPQQYVFNSGMQVAGTIDAASGGPWAGDTTGAFFFDNKGTTQHGEGVEPIWNYAVADDRAHWPQAAYVPLGDSSAAFFDPSLRGLPAASEGDLWTLAWDGDSALTAGRKHPFGIAMETRVLGWNHPVGNEDILYFIHTFYNISSTCAADYAAIRPAMQQELLPLATRFQLMNDAKYGITLPACGYTIKDLWLGLAYDPDVSDNAGNNYSSVDLPLGLGYTYQTNFQKPSNGYQLPWDLGSAPFLNGYGFVGMKFLRTPVVAGQEAGITLFSNITGGGLFGDPPNAPALYRYLSARMSPAYGDGNCNYLQATDHICFVKNDGPADLRGFQSTGPVDLPPGGSVTIVTAYVFASAVASGGCPAAGCATVPPGDPRHLSDAAYLAASGANLIDSLTGFRGYVDDNIDGQVQGSEFRTVRGSLLQKAQLAQTIFDRKFLVSSAPDAPDFFLIPGDDQVSVLWRPSTTEANGDPFFTAASSPSSPAYDPNFRQFDVAGYRIYRGRVDAPSALTLVAQFAYAQSDALGRVTDFRDYLGTVDPATGCAPELGKRLKTDGCPVDFDAPPAPGGSYSAHFDHPVESDFIQVKRGDRFFRSDGSLFTAEADTAVTGGNSGLPQLFYTGVPFTYVDHTVKNNLRYFYTVTAFDVNSIESGPSSLESSRKTKPVTPVHTASNYASSGAITSFVHYGRGVNMDSVFPNDPAIDATTGVFSGPARPATGVQVSIAGDILSRVIAHSGEIGVTLIGEQPGSAYDGIPAVYTLAAGLDTLQLSILLNTDATPISTEASFRGLAVDPALAGRYGGAAGYALQSTLGLEVPGNYLNGAFGRGCVNDAGHTGGSCGYDGARWFSGATETFAHPTQANGPNTSPQPAAIAPTGNATNAGSLPGILSAYEARSYQTRDNSYRQVEGVLGTVSTAADYQVYWGTPGHIDSVIDITHNVVVPFDSSIKKGYTWGLLTVAGTNVAGSGDGRPGVLTVTDFGCVEPLSTFGQSAAYFGCTSGAPFTFVSTAVAGPIAIGNNVASDATIGARANTGFGMYLAGHIFLFELAPAAALPSATIWTMRSYTGAINHGGVGCGSCGAGNLGNYTFLPAPSPFTAVGASVATRFTVSNTLSAATEADLARVHTVPDPYYVSNGFEADPAHKVIKFVNLPAQAIIRIYSLSGVLVKVIEHNSGTLGGAEDWDVRNRSGRLIANGVYFYAIEAGEAHHVGRMTIVTLGR